jgi:hypothetical protein
MTTVAQLRPQLEKMLTKMLGSVGVVENGSFTVQAGSSRLFISADQFNDAHTTISIFAFTNLGIKGTPEFFRYIATNSEPAAFGHLLAVERDDGTCDVVLSHRLLGTNIDFAELEGAIFVVGNAADGLDEQIKEKFGGRTFHEAPDEATAKGEEAGGGYL